MSNGFWTLFNCGSSDNSCYLGHNKNLDDDDDEDDDDDIVAESSRRKCCVWNYHDHVTTLPMAIPDAEISAVRFS